MFGRFAAVFRQYSHIQASWFSEGKRPGRFHFTSAGRLWWDLIDENVHKATGHVNKTSIDETVQMIREAGFTPAQRTTLYDILKIYNLKTQPVSYQRVIYVCTNVREEDGRPACGREGLKRSCARLKEEVKKRGLKGKVRAMKSGCMDFAK